MTRKRYTNRTIGVVAIIAAVAAIASIWFRTHDPLDTQAMLDASVSIRTVSHVHVDQFGDSVWEAGSGSGFLVSTARCEVWSNHHVVENAAFVEVFPRGWTGSSGIAAKVVNASPRTDVAILHLERCDGIREAVLGDSDHLRPGDETYAVGNPLGRNPDSISRGIISHTNRTLTGIASYLQTDAAINPGNSGGALFDAKGPVIGISTALASLGEATNIGIGYAVPINVAGKVVAGLRDGPPR